MFKEFVSTQQAYNFSTQFLARFSEHADCLNLHPPRYGFLCSFDSLSLVRPTLGGLFIASYHFSSGISNIGSLNSLFWNLVVLSPLSHLTSFLKAIFPNRMLHLHQTIWILVVLLVVWLLMMVERKDKSVDFIVIFLCTLSFLYLKNLQ